MADLQSIQTDQHRSIDALIASFREHLQTVITRAQAQLIGYLQKNLSITDGVIDQTPGNFRILRSLDTRFAQFLQSSGYDSLVSAFVNEFPGQLPFLDETLATLSESSGIDLGSVVWTQADRDVFSSLALTTQDAIFSAVSTVAGNTMTRTMFTLGGLDFGKLVAIIGERLNVSVSRAVSMADTGMMVFYRTATDRAFQKIEQDLPSQVLRFQYAGPDDRVTRVFCKQLVESGKSYTREEIDVMDNHQIPNVMLSCGGVNCRHQWLLAFS